MNFGLHWWDRTRQTSRPSLGLRPRGCVRINPSARRGCCPQTPMLVGAITAAAIAGIDLRGLMIAMKDIQIEQ
jgi:hypothetical protein